jgi:hypothetical protein
VSGAGGKPARSADHRSGAASGRAARANFKKKLNIDGVRRPYDQRAPVFEKNPQALKRPDAAPFARYLFPSLVPPSVTILIAFMTHHDAACRG